MIVNVEKAKDESVVVSSQESLAEAKFEVRVDEKLYSILSSSIYADKVKSPIRELSCNAYDAHVAAGKADEPIHVQLPTREDPTFAVQDFGLGMSAETIMNLYTQYGASDKLASNDVVGCWGLGSKSPFAYTKTFTVVSVHEGVRNVFVATIENGCPTIRHEMSEQTEDPSGTTVAFVVSVEDIERFTITAKDFYRTFRPYPVINGFVADVPEQDIRYGVLLNAPHPEGTRDNFVLMGNVRYGFWLDSLRNAAPKELLGVFTKLDTWIGNTYVLPIGAIDITVSREAVELTDKSVRAITKAMEHYVNSVYAEYEKLKTEIKDLKEFDRKIALLEFRAKYRGVRFASDEADESVKAPITAGSCVQYALWQMDGYRNRYRTFDAYWSFEIHPYKYVNGVRLEVLYNDNSHNVSKTATVKKFAEDHRGTTRLDIYVIGDATVAKELKNKGVPVTTLSEYRESIKHTSPKKPRNVSTAKDPKAKAPGWNRLTIHPNYYMGVSSLTYGEVESLKNSCGPIYYIDRCNSGAYLDNARVRGMFSAQYDKAVSVLRKKCKALESANIRMLDMFRKDTPTDIGFKLAKALVMGRTDSSQFSVLCLSETAAETIKGDAKFVNLYDKIAKLCSGVEGKLVDNILNGLIFFAPSWELCSPFSVDKSWAKFPDFTEFDAFAAAKKAYDSLSLVDKAVLEAVVLSDVDYSGDGDLPNKAKVVVHHRNVWAEALTQMFPFLDHSLSIRRTYEPVCADKISRYVEAMTLWHKKNTFKKGEKNA